MAGTTHLLAFEIGAEEIPAFDLAYATKQFEQLLGSRFDEAKIPHGEISVYTTPRRLIGLVADVAEEIPAQHQEFKGPKAAIAFDAEGNPTKAALGFARGKGLDISACEKRVVDGDEYLFAVVDVPAKPVAGLLVDLLGGIIPALSWPRSCRWGSTSETFTRPVRWLVALLGDQVIPVTYAGLTAGTTTRGHRVLCKEPLHVPTAEDLLDVVRSGYVVPSMAEREAVIRAGVAEIEQASGATAVLPDKTMLEVTNLTEYPTPLMGVFDEAFLQVPEEIIVDAMLMHQRYFPLYDEAGKLTNKFIIVSNGDPAFNHNIIDGNQRVVRARLDDAKFFYEEDLKNPLESYIDKLDQVVFQEKLGTVKDKALRLASLGAHLADAAELNDQDSADLVRALLLCKADLVTNAVIEFTSVQGVMGSYYAAASGETEQVAKAIGQHYQPRFAGDELPDGVVGKLTACADKLDTICGLFAVGQGPTGSKDPFALRRSAIGVVNMLRADLPISLAAAVEASLDTFEGLDFDRAAVAKEVMDFFITRTKVMLKDEGARPDSVEAVLAGGVVEPVELVARTKALEALRAEDPEGMESLAIAYARANNLRDASLGTDIDTAMLIEPEQNLLHAIETAEQGVAAALASNDYPQALQALVALRGPIDAFFEAVMIMDDDEAVRANRLRLLNRFVSVFAQIADFGKMAKK